ncbi:MAG: thioredoxin family protein [Chitinophagaceae bacterium]
MKHNFLLLLMFTALVSVKGQEAVPSAADVLKIAYQQAAKENKNVLMMFHASWCGWCHRMDKSLNDEACKKFFDDNYIITHLVVDETKDKKNLENPGAAELKIKYNGDGQGIPFWLVLDKEGNLLSDSKIRKEGEGPDKGENTGCPATEEEVDFFISVLKKTSSITNDQLEIIRKRFRENDK